VARSSLTRSLCIVLLVFGATAIAWGALAFGAVYPWAFTPLALGCASVGVAALVIGRRNGPPNGALAAALLATGLAIALQLVPLPSATLALISPAADAFQHYDVSDTGARGSGEGARRQAGPEPHAISISPQKTVLGLALFAAFALFLTGMVRLVSIHGASAIVAPLVGFGVILAVVGILQYSLWSDKDLSAQKIYGFWRPQYPGNAFGPFVNRNHFAGWMIMVLPLALGAAAAAWERGKHINDRLRWISTASGGSLMLTGLATAVMGLTLFMCQSRSGLAGFGAAMLIVGWIVIQRQSTNRAKVAAAATMAIILITVAGWAGVDRITDRLSSVEGDAPTAGGRVQAWSDTVRIARDFPITGTGLNTYGTAMLLYQSGNRDVHFQEAHNDYLQLAAEGGLLVCVPVLLTIAIFVRDVRRRFSEAPKEGTTYWLRVGAVVGLISIALQSLLEFSLQMPGNAALFAAVAAIAIHQSPNLRAARRSKPAVSS
jgi:O-antigen ligase